MSKIKIIHLQVLPILSGVQNMMLQVLSGLDQKKYQIYVLSRSDGALVEKVKESGWTHLALDSLVREFSLKDFVSAWKLYFLIRKIKPDIVHTHSAKTGFLGRIVARLSRVPLVIHTIHGFPFHQYQNPIKRFVFILLESFAGFFAHFNVFVNQYEKEMAVHKLGFSKKKSLTIYNGVLPYHKQKIFSNDNSLKIVSVLRFTEQKNVVSTIEQAVKVAKKYDNVSFAFYGDGELFNICERIVLDSDVGERVELKGWVYDIQNVLLNYDVFLLNSLWEGLPISILEAMSVGLPVICSNIKGNNELVDSHNGWLVEPYDLNSLDSVVHEILNNKNILAEKGRESIIKVTKQFHYGLFINEYERLYSCTKGNSDE